jgi:hypothetical protein
MIEYRITSKFFKKFTIFIHNPFRPQVSSIFQYLLYTIKRTIELWAWSLSYLILLLRGYRFSIFQGKDEISSNHLLHPISKTTKIRAQGDILLLSSR